MEAQVSEESWELYSSANGDFWLLVHDAEHNRVFVRHVPNAPSGAKTQEIGIATFLSRGPQGPEHEALLDLIGLLVSGFHEGVRSSVV
jgi:hypothetical protein